MLLLAFHLYDGAGCLVAESAGFEHFPEGVTIRSNKGELLLNIPPNLNGHVRYKLYNCNGHLLTTSDGARTKIYPELRMEGVGHGWAPPAA